MIKTEDGQYFLCRNKSPYLIKNIQEINLEFNYLDFSSVLKILKELNYPFVVREYLRVLDYFKNVYSDDIPVRVLSRYLSIMNLASYRNFTYKDSDILNCFVL